MQKLLKCAPGICGSSPTRTLRRVPAKEIFETDALVSRACWQEASGNLFVLQAIQQQNRLRRLLEFGSYHNKRRVKAWCEEHVAIIDACERTSRNWRQN
jgi:hypothetical protein